MGEGQGQGSLYEQLPAFSGQLLCAGLRRVWAYPCDQSHCERKDGMRMEVGR